MIKKSVITNGKLNSFHEVSGGFSVPTDWSQDVAEILVHTDEEFSSKEEYADRVIISSSVVVLNTKNEVLAICRLSTEEKGGERVLRITDGGSVVTSGSASLGPRQILEKKIQGAGSFKRIEETPDFATSSDVKAGYVFRVHVILLEDEGDGVESLSEDKVCGFVSINTALEGIRDKAMEYQLLIHVAEWLARQATQETLETIVDQLPNERQEQIRRELASMVVNS